MFHLRLPAIPQVTDIKTPPSACEPRLCKSQQVTYVDLAWPVVEEDPE